MILLSHRKWVSAVLKWPPPFKSQMLIHCVPPLDPITPNTPHIIMKERCYTSDGSEMLEFQKVRCITFFLFVLFYSWVLLVCSTGAVAHIRLCSRCLVQERWVLMYRDDPEPLRTARMEMEKICNYMKCKRKIHV